MNRFLLLLILLTLSQGMTAQQAFPGNLRPQWLDTAVIYEVNLRQFTASGTLKDFAAHLPRLQKMGVNVLWLMPVHPVSRQHRKGSLGSPYSVATYSEVNPEFGTNEDFRLLVQQAHQLGMKVILDWVPNHTGWSHMWIKKHPDWYVRDPLIDTIMHPMGTDWHDVADLNFDVPELRIEMIRSLLHWIDAYSIDGFHFDKAMMVPEEFWLQFGKILRQLNKSILLIGEANEARWLESGLFHVDYSWTFMQLMREVAMGVKSAADLRYFFQEDSMAYRKGQHLYFTTMHQENSWQGSEWIPLGQAQNLFTVMSFVLDGVPMIYNGQEEPLERSLRFYDKDTIAFENLGHAGFLSELIRLRTSHQALFPGEKGGRMTALQTTHADQVLAFKRKVPGDELICLFNCSNKPVSCNLVEGLDKAKYLEHFSKKKTALQPGHAIELEPWACKIFIRQ